MCIVAINLNPYQGLKRCFASENIGYPPVAINLNPYQGLKLKKNLKGFADTFVAINLNPYQGLKLAIKVSRLCNVAAIGCNQPKSLSGIETHGVFFRTQSP